MYARPACLPRIGNIYVTDVVKADTAPDGVQLPRPSAPCASRPGAPTGRRMGGVECAPPQIKRRCPTREPTVAARTTQRSTTETAGDGRGEAMDLNE
jgi:hypothetical protein